MMVLPLLRNAVWISIQRCMRKPEYSSEELELVSRDGRHVEASLRIGIRMLNAEGASFTLLQFLSALDFGVFLLDGAGQVIFKNEAANTAVANGLHLSRALKQKVQPGPTEALSPWKTSSSERPIIVPRSNGRPFVIYALPGDLASVESARSGQEHERS